MNDYDAHTFGEKCYFKHPEMLFKGSKVYGGSCYSPVIKTADTYVSLCSGHMTSQVGRGPWNGYVAVDFFINDGCAPTGENIAEYKSMVDWLCTRLDEGKSLHIGCIGGHGRTGTLLAALAKVYLDQADAVTYIRSVYCSKAVESKAQLDFLRDVFGVSVSGVFPSRSITSAYSGCGSTIFRGRAPTSGSKGLSFMDRPNVKVINSSETKDRGLQTASKKGKITRQVHDSKSLWCASVKICGVGDEC